MNIGNNGDQKADFFPTLTKLPGLQIQTLIHTNGIWVHFSIKKPGNPGLGEASPHPEDEVDVGFLPNVELVVGWEPNPALGVVEGKEAVAERGNSCQEWEKNTFLFPKN